MLNSVLIAVDGSPQADAVVTLAQQILSCQSAEVHIICVVDSGYFSPDDEKGSEVWDGLVYPAARYEHQAARQMIARAVSRLEEEGYRATGNILPGEPVTVIIREAARLKAGLIVMGHRHLSALKRWAEPSVVKEVIDLANCPVLVENQFSA